MKLVADQLKEWNPITGKDELKSMDLTLYCKSEEEFMAAWEKIKDIDGVTWCGCPDEEENHYIDLVAVVKKERGWTNGEVLERLKEIRAEIEEALKIGKFRNK